MPIIEVKNLSAFYESKKVFENVNFSIEKGEYVCVLGENGSGKTTLMRCILDLSVKHSGEICLGELKGSDIGWLPQRTETQKDFPASVMEVVLSGFCGRQRLGLFYSKSLRNQALSEMKRLDILHLKNRSFKELSGGQQQRVLLCRALCAAGSIILLDEPTSGLDTASKRELYKTVKKLHLDGVTVIMISHDEERALIEADKILCMQDSGSFFGTPEEYLEFKAGREV